MTKANSSPTPDMQICQDRMMLKVINVYPDFQKKSEQEVRQEISAGLYRIFRKYASHVPEGRC